MTPEAAQALAQIGLSAMLLMGMTALWREFQAERKQHLADLKEIIKSDIGEIKSRLILIEDNLHARNGQYPLASYHKYTSDSDPPDH